MPLPLTHCFQIRKDIFQLFFDLAIRAGLNHEELEPINKEVKLIIELVEKLKIYDQRVIDYRWSEYQNYEFGSNGLEEVASVGADPYYIEDTQPSH